MILTRLPAVADAFYPADPATLTNDILAYLDAVEDGASSNLQSHESPPKAIVAPHAGYIYSGPVAAHAYAKLAPLRGKVTRVVVLGPSHRVAMRGLALSAAQRFSTPLGEIEVDHDFDRVILALPQVQVYDDAHTLEHSLEVQLPFLQVVLGTFKVLPIVVGEATPQETAQVLESVWDGDETLIVVSSDLSHYLDYAHARTTDQQTRHAIETLDASAIGRDQACGSVPLKGLLEVARRQGLSVETLDLRNSGDTAGERDRVVGYGAWGFWERHS